MAEATHEQLRVLVIEDSEDDALLLIRELSRGGFDVEHSRADTEESMRNALSTRTWDVLITDHNMPEFDSSRALQVLQSSGMDIPVIIVSGSIGEEIAVDAMKAGAHDYIMKNNLTRLVPAVRRELREAERRRAHRKAEATIRHLAYHDALTGLVNRTEFERRLRQGITSARQRNITHTLLYFDLDQFKIINDTCGHVAGDELLRCLAVTLQHHIRERDTLARLGGDEFGVLLENCPIDQGEGIAEVLRQTIQDFRFVWKEKTFSVGASVGVVAIDATSTNIDEILSAADMSCYAAKDRGRNRIHVYREDDSELHRRHGEMQWASRINSALQQNRFCLYKHRIISLNDQQPSECCEFLLRMVGEDHNLVLPGVFIPAAERYNLMPAIDRWVLEHGFRLLAENSDKLNCANAARTYFFNLSATSLSDTTFTSFIQRCLRKYALPPDIICFEITETAAITDFRNAVEFIESIKKAGCLFALDDFGTGMSSFSYLKRMPVDFIKIDGSFVRNMLHDPIDCSIVEAINNIGHVAGIKIIAEFVEQKEILSELKKINVDFAQGYAIERPHPALID